MIHASFVAALAAAALAAQGSSPSGNYSGLQKMIKPTAPHQLKAAPVQSRQYGRVIEDHPAKVERGPCGMPIIAANAAVDPKIIVPIREGAAKTTNTPTVEPADRCGPFGAVPAAPQRK